MNTEREWHDYLPLVIAIPAWIVVAVIALAGRLLLPNVVLDKYFRN